MASAGYGLAHDAAALQSRLALLEVEVQDKRKTIDTLRRALADAKEHEKQALQDTTRQWETKLHDQKSHYECGLERNLKLVDRLLNDKTELTKRCEFFADEMKAVERKFQMKIEGMDEQASKELERQKKNWMAAERLRREAWEKEKVREIKEITIRGLQPEVERILAERKQEKQRLEDQHREALEEQRQKLTELGHAQAREARERASREQERAIEEERELHRKRARDEFERFTMQLEEERRKCAADVLSERRRREQAEQQAAEELERRVREAVAETRAAREAAAREASAAAAAAEERHRHELEELRVQLSEEAATNSQRQLDEAARGLKAREAELRKELAAERDQQLDVLVDRLSREHVEQQQALREDAAEQVRRARAEAGEAAERQRDELEAARRRTDSLADEVAKLRTAQAALQGARDAEAEHARGFEARVQELEARLVEVQRAAAAERVQHDEGLQGAQELKARELAGMRLELQRLERCVEEERGRAREQQREAEQRQEAVIGELEARVKRTLQAKDDTIGELRLRCAAHENKIREFEYLLARQREELLADITRSSVT